VDITRAPLAHSCATGDGPAHPKSIQKAIRALVDAHLVVRVDPIAGRIPVYRLTFPEGTYNAHVDTWAEPTDSPDDHEGGEPTGSDPRIPQDPPNPTTVGSCGLPLVEDEQSRTNSPCPKGDHGSRESPVPDALVDLVWKHMVLHLENHDEGSAMFIAALTPHSTKGSDLVDRVREVLVPTLRDPLSLELPPKLWTGTNRRRWFVEAVRRAGQRYLEETCTH